MKTLRLALVAAAAAATLTLQGCEVLALGAIAGSTAAVAVDRRTTATQLEDKTIELKAEQRAKELVGDRGNVTATAYNRNLLLTGQVATEADKAAVAAAAQKVDNVRGVVNELSIGLPSSLADRAGDSVLAGRVRAKLIDAADVASTAFKITVDSSVVYLMGMVTEAESRRATQLAASIPGVKKVIRVLEQISNEDLQKLRSRADGTR